MKHIYNASNYFQYYQDMMSYTSKILEKPTRAEDQLLMLLKTHGAYSTANLARACGTTSEAVRQQIVKLVEQGLVEGVLSRTGVGRPKQLWHLTGTGHARFPDSHAPLTVQIIESVGAVFGQDGISRMLEHRGTQQLARYQARLATSNTLEERVMCLAKIRTEEGYMADVQRDGHDFVFIENHCPICAAATGCQQLCMSELMQFQTLMQGWATVSREEHLLAGGHRCVYRLQAV